MTFGLHHDADVKPSMLELAADGTDMVVLAQGREIPFRVAIPGPHIAQNSLAVVAVYTLTVKDDIVPWDGGAYYFMAGETRRRGRAEDQATVLQRADSHQHRIHCRRQCQRLSPQAPGDLRLAARTREIDPRQ